MVRHREGAENYARAAEALGGAAKADALPEIFSALLRSCRIAAQPPDVCTGVSAAELAAAMKSDANHGISQNAACPVSFDDLDEMAGMMMALPLARAA